MESSLTKLLQVGFLAASVASVAAFSRTALDGENRRAPSTLVQHLSPDYTGENRTAPDFTLRDRSGRTVRLSELRGKVVVLHFWTRTCQPCVEELRNSLPVFDELVRDRSDIALLMVTVDANWEAVAPLVPTNFRSPILFDPDRSVVANRFGTRLFPETWVIDPRGVIRARFDHPVPWDGALWLSYLESLR